MVYISMPMPKLKKKTPASKTAKKTTASKASAKKKPVAKKASAKKKPAVKKTPVKKKPVAKKAPAKKKPAAKKAPAKKKPAAKKVTPAATPVRKVGRAVFRRQITKILLEKKKQILLEVSGKIKNESDVLKLDTGDIYDVASSERERELVLILGDRDRDKLSEIEEALDRLNDKTYGECEDCGEPIAEQRLLALPFTCVCVECKSRYERHHGVGGRYEDEHGLGMLERAPAEEEEV
jgi:DnaK suppressor protein